MDNTLVLAYKALENWQIEVTVDKFIEDNKRLNSNANINSPNISIILEKENAQQNS